MHILAAIRQVLLQEKEDTTSAFAGKGKKLWSYIITGEGSESAAARSSFSSIGQNFEVPTGTILDLEAFTCQLYTERRVMIQLTKYVYSLKLRIN